MAQESLKSVRKTHRKKTAYTVKLEKDAVREYARQMIKNNKKAKNQWYGIDEEKLVSMYKTVDFHTIDGWSFPMRLKKV
jgi:hypothetical protein